MDILSSQANLAGYKAIIDSFAIFNYAMMTAAGTISRKVLVVGAGVAGLQAIATAKEWEQCICNRCKNGQRTSRIWEKFFNVEVRKFRTEGYAKVVSDDFKKKQENLLKETLKNIDVVICTALIPGKKAPLIINKNMINEMKSGSIIYDLAAIQGGNAELTKLNEIINHNGVKIVGEKNILNKLPVSSSNLYSKNVFNFVSNLYDKEKKQITINLEDEIVEKTMIK